MKGVEREGRHHTHREENVRSKGFDKLRNSVTPKHKIIVARVVRCLGKDRSE